MVKTRPKDAWRPMRPPRRTASVREWALAQVAARVQLLRPQEGDEAPGHHGRPPWQAPRRFGYKGRTAGRPNRPTRSLQDAPQRTAKQNK